MWVRVNGVLLFFDVEGAGLVPDGPRMREKPTVVLLHGGPGFDHSLYKPAFSALADIAQIVFLDHRGNGRSDGGPPESWTLAQWGDDVRAFCDTLGIARPIVYGASFGWTVALAYATRHPAHPAALILVSTEAAAGTHRDRQVALFERFGGPEVCALARRRFIDGHTDAATLDAWIRLATPSTCFRPSLECSVQPSSWVASARPISPPRSHPTSCVSSGLRAAATRSCPMRGSARWR